MQRRLRALAVAGLAGLANVVVAAVPGIWMPALGALQPGTAEVAFGLLATANGVLRDATLTIVPVAAGFRLTSRPGPAPGPAEAAAAFTVVGVASTLAAYRVSRAVSTAGATGGVDPYWLATSATLFALSGLVGALLVRWAGDGGGVVAAGSG